MTPNVSFLPPSALQNGRSQFVINGNWKISVPGEYSVAGTKLLYRRSADTWESFEVPGPTQEDLHLMVRLSEDTRTRQFDLVSGAGNVLTFNAPFVHFNLIAKSYN